MIIDLIYESFYFNKIEIFVMHADRKRRARQFLLFFLYTLGFLSIVSSGGGNGDGDGDESITYNYTVTSANYFTGGQQVAVIRFGISGSCSDVKDVTSGITRVGDGTVTTPGTVSFSFTTDITPPMFESVYIDNNASGNLDNGDRVWGDNPNDLIGACWDNFSTDQVFDWEVVAIQLQDFLTLAQSSIIYTGPPQAFRGEPGLELGLTMKNSVIADTNCSGYSDGVPGKPCFISPQSIDINPGSDNNLINSGIKQAIPVAVLGSTKFDATQIDFSTVRLGAGRASPTHAGHVEDVNNDGFMDMIFHFNSQEAGIVCGDTVATLMGEVFAGTRFIGTDAVKTIDCN